MKRQLRQTLFRQNRRFTRMRGIPLDSCSAMRLKELTCKFGLSVAASELMLFSGSWYITHAGLMHIAARRGCAGIEVIIDQALSDPRSARWVAKAVVYRSAQCKGFTGYGDADPSNVSPVVAGAEIRMAETRAVNRALRKAYGIGLCSVEELTSSPSPPVDPAFQRQKPVSSAANLVVNGNGHRLRDRLSLIVRQHELDPVLVKAYAADFCQVSELRRASRAQVAEFIAQLEQQATLDRNQLLCLLNSYRSSDDPQQEAVA